MKLMKSRKGFTIGDLGNIAISFGVAVIVLAVMATVVQTLRDDQTTADTAARNATDFGLESINTLSSFLPLVALAAVGAIVVGIVVRFFLNKG
jgi:heme/copper-type cytochrome/quinol oxidase subunit 2